MRLLRRHKPPPVDMTPDPPPDRTSRRLQELADEWRAIEAKRAEQAERRYIRASQDEARLAWGGGYLREWPTAVYPIVQPHNGGDPAG